MNVIWGAILVLFTLMLGWLAQVINAFLPALAARLGLNEPESEVDATFFVDTRGEAIWDAMIVWTLPAAGILLLVNSPLWPYFGLVGGGMYLYFAGRGIVVRLVMQRRGIRIGQPGTLKLAYGFLTLYGLIGVVTTAMAAAALSAR
ncbi:MAG: hypothetical protein M5U01_17005 [Ardenticatenaceae bacterium]|nr:hypothetical protein [Ardenticatenaceae bacterium]